MIFRKGRGKGRKKEYEKAERSSEGRVTGKRTREREKRIGIRMGVGERREWQRNWIGKKNRSKRVGVEEWKGRQIGLEGEKEWKVIAMVEKGRAI